MLRGTNWNLLIHPLYLSDDDLHEGAVKVDEILLYKRSDKGRVVHANFRGGAALLGDREDGR